MLILKNSRRFSPAIIVVFLIVIILLPPSLNLSGNMKSVFAQGTVPQGEGQSDAVEEEEWTGEITYIQSVSQENMEVLLIINLLEGLHLIIMQ
jgi:hypothetical protein